MIFVIQTRQKAARLFPTHISELSDQLDPLGGSESLAQGPVEVSGYAVIAVMAISDQPFTITFYEGVSPTGEFSVSQQFTSQVVDGRFVVTERFTRSGSFMKMVFENTSSSPETYLNLLVQGVPCP